jgi:hypothetical protein
MTEFTKTKIHFALALLGAIFALHPFLQRWEDASFYYLGFEVKVFYAYILVAGLLSLSVYCFGLTLVSERVHAGMERLGNYFYALAVMVIPLIAGLYLSGLLADRVGQSHLAWAAPGLALGLGIGWLLLSQLLAWLVRGRLGQQDQNVKLEQLAKQEITSVNRARELFDGEHYDLSFIEAWRALESRLRRVLLMRGVSLDNAGPEQIIQAVKRARILRESNLALLREMKDHWHVAMSSEPLGRDAAQAALRDVRYLLSIIPLDKSTSNSEDRPPGPELRVSA